MPRNRCCVGPCDNKSWFQLVVNISRPLNVRDPRGLVSVLNFSKSAMYSFSKRAQKSFLQSLIDSLFSKTINALAAKSSVLPVIDFPQTMRYSAVLQVFQESPWNTRPRRPLSWIYLSWLPTMQHFLGMVYWFRRGCPLLLASRKSKS